MTTPCAHPEMKPSGHARRDITQSLWAWISFTIFVSSQMTNEPLMINSFTYLQGNTADGPPTADESPPPQALPTRVAELLGDVLRFCAVHYPPKSQGKKKYTNPRTGGPTCSTNEIIHDAIYASLPDDCKLTFAQMFDNFDDLCPFKAPLYVKGEKFDFNKHVLNLLTNDERAEWRRVTIPFEMEIHRRNQ